MKRVLLMLAATAAFACTTAMAQAGGAAGAGAGSTSGTANTGTNATGAGAGSNVGSGAQTGSSTQANTTHRRHHKGMNGGTAKLTGCISSSPGSDGMYTLTSKKNKEIEVGPTDKIQANAGNKVRLTGHWTTAAGAGENTSGVASSTNNEQNERHFEVDNVKKLSDTCTAGAMSGNNSGKHHHKKGGASGSANVPPPTV